MTVLPNFEKILQEYTHTQNAPCRALENFLASGDGLTLQPKNFAEAPKPLSSPSTKHFNVTINVYFCKQLRA